MISPASLPLYFQANSAQTEFLSSGNGYQFAISASGVQMALRESRDHAATAQMRFAGGNPAAQIHGAGEMPGKINYLIGNDPSKWQTDLPTFANVQVSELYPGINMIFHGNQRQLEYDFTIAPGADPNAIKMQFGGVDNISVTPQGDLVLKIGTHELRQPAPEIYQTIGGARKMIAGGYKILDSRSVAFYAGEYDRSRPLVIDPVLGYSTFFGGNVGDTAWATTLDINNSIYIAGETFSTKFFTAGAVQTNFAGGPVNGDAFVAKFDSTQTNLIYLTYVGGTADDLAVGLAVDQAGNAFIGGYTDSTNFPTTNALYAKIPAAYNSSFRSQPGSGFVSELNTNGTSLMYSTYLGGNSANFVESIALDSADNVYAVGYTYATNFPVTANALQTRLQSTNGTAFLNPNGFVTEIASNDASLVYSSYLGGTNYDAALGVTVDTNSNVYVCGYTASYNFPTWNTPANLRGGRFLNGVTNQASVRFLFDAFVTKFPPLSGAISPAAQKSFYSTFLGGTNNDGASGIAADAAGNAYVTGWTSSTNFPVINTPINMLTSFLTTNGNSGPVATNAFLTKIGPNGSVSNSVVFGGNLVDLGYKVAVDQAGDAFVVGTETSYTNFPTRNAFGSLLATNSSGVGYSDAFVTGIDAEWTNVLYSVCIGGNLNTEGHGIALDSSTNVYITGATLATNYPTINAGRFSFNGTNVINGTNYISGTRFTGTNDAFLTEIIFAPNAVNISGIEPTNDVTVGLGATVTFGVTATGGSGQVLYQWQKGGTNLVNKGRIIGANSPTLTITNAQPSDSSVSNIDYSLIVNYPGLIVSSTNTYTNELVESNIVLSVLPTPYIAVALTNQIVLAGATVDFSAVASGSPINYIWGYSNSVEFHQVTNTAQISGMTNSTLTITDAQPTNDGFYEIVVQYNHNLSDINTNSGALLTVVEPLSIVTAPTNEIVSAGSTVSFTVVASGSPLSYQWSNSVTGTFLTDGTNISGAASSTLTITNVQTADAGTYTVFVNNGQPYTFLSGSTNLSATLTVTPASDPVFTGFAPVAGGPGSGIVLSGTGGTTNGTYYVLTSSNMLVPITQWTPMATNRFNSMGQFIFTNPVSTNGSQFFILKQP